MAIHILKSHPVPFGDVWDKGKLAEVRREDDRIFSVGDTITLLELESPGSDWATGREITALISHVQRGYGLPPGLAVLSIGVCLRHQSQRRTRLDQR
jgi:hypothetical protein